jgi:pimeloyl-ACP methyl ester carboxylesterase
MSELDATTRDISVDGTDVRVYVAGPDEGRPILLLHGGGMDATGVSWKKAFPALSETHRVYALDWPGYGESDPVPETKTPHVDYYVDVLGAVLSELELLEVTLVGISKGGGIALGYTLDRPARVSRLCLVDSYGLGGEVPGGKLGAAYVKAPKLLEATWWAMKRSRRVTRASMENLVNPANLDEEFVDDAVREVQRPNAGDAYRRFQRAEVGWRGLRTNYADRMSELPVPTLFVHGEDDDLIPLEQSKAAADTAPVADLFTLADCVHWPPREHPEAFVARLDAWLQRG